MRLICKILFFFAVCSCQPNSPKEFRSEGISLMRSICKDLKQVRTKKDLEKRKDRLIKKYQQLSDLIIQTHEWKKKYPELFYPQDFQPKENFELQKEIKRVCCIEGNRELLESFQKPALKKLNRFYSRVE